MKNSVRFGHFQFYAGHFARFDGLNQTLTVSGLAKNPIKIFNRILEVVKPHKVIWISIKVKYQ